MRIDKENVKEKPADKAEYFGEFSKTEIASLFPAAELLQKIHSDHVYTTNEQSDYQSSDDADDSYEYTHQDDILSLNADSIQQVFQRMVNMTSLNSMVSDQPNHSEDSDPISDPRSKDARSPFKRKVKFVDDLPEILNKPSTSRDSSDLKDSENKARKRDSLEREKKQTKSKKKGSQKTGRKGSIKDGDDHNNKIGVKTRNKRRETNKKKENGASMCKSVSEEEWKTANRCAEVERELNTLIRFTAELLVRRWGEYLSMTTEQIATFEIENAKQHKMVENVIDMLEDKDRYVWQLIEELRFY